MLACFYPFRFECWRHPWVKICLCLFVCLTISLCFSPFRCECWRHPWANSVDFWPSVTEKEAVETDLCHLLLARRQNCSLFCPNSTLLTNFFTQNVTNEFELIVLWRFNFYLAGVKPRERINLINFLLLFLTFHRFTLELGWKSFGHYWKNCHTTLASYVIFEEREFREKYKCCKHVFYLSSKSTVCHTEA